MIKKYIVYIIFMALVFTGCKDSNSIHLSYQLNEGATYSYQYTSHQEMNQNISGSTNNVILDLKIQLNFHIQSAKDSTYNVVFHYSDYERDLGKQSQADLNINTKTGQNEASKLFKEILELPIHFEMNKKGVISNLTIQQKQIDALLQAKANLFQSSEVAILQGELASILSPDKFKVTIEQMTKIYPDQLLEKDSKWEISVPLNLPFDAYNKITYMLNNVHSNEATIMSEGTMEVENQKTNLEGVETIFNLTGNSNGEIKVDIPTAWVNNAHLEHKMKGTIEVLNEGNPLTIPFTIVNKITYKGIRTH